jgi:hypothetical protein
MSKSSENKYYLNIHHRSIAINIDQEAGTLEQSASPGHFYVSFQKNDERQFFGKYAQGKQLIKQIIGEEVIVSRQEELFTRQLDMLKALTGKEHHSFKSIILTEEQYDNALDYALSKIDGRIEPGSYILAIDDCTDFVQQVYNKAGLPLYFTTAFTREDLSTLGSMAALNVLNKYGSSDCLDLTFASIKATSKEALARSLNIDASNITSNMPDMDLEAPVYTLPSFKVAFEEIELPRVFANNDSAAKSSSVPVVDEDEDVLDFTSMTNLLPLTEEQKKQAAGDMKNFFTGMMNNPCAQTPEAFQPSAFFPQPDEETQKWAQDLADRTNDMMRDMFGNNTTHQPYNAHPYGHNPFGQFQDVVSRSTTLMGQVFNNSGLDLSDTDSLD